MHNTRPRRTRGFREPPVVAESALGWWWCACGVAGVAGVGSVVGVGSGVVGVGIGVSSGVVGVSSGVVAVDGWSSGCRWCR